MWENTLQIYDTSLQIFLKKKSSELLFIWYQHSNELQGSVTYKWPTSKQNRDNMNNKYWWYILLAFKQPKRNNHFKNRWYVSSTVRTQNRLYLKLGLGITEVANGMLKNRLMVQTKKWHHVRKTWLPAVLCYMFWQHSRYPVRPKLVCSIYKQRTNSRHNILYSSNYSTKKDRETCLCVLELSWNQVTVIL